MGANEDELARIKAAGPFQITELAALRNSLAALAVTMKDIAGSPGWEGMSADAAGAWFETLSRQYFDLESFIGDLQVEVDRANEIRSAALADFEALPSAQAPDWVHGTLDAFDFPGLPDPVDLAQGGLALIEGFLGSQRDAAAGRILAAYTEALAEPALRTDTVIENVNRYTITMGGDVPEVPEPEPGPDTDTTGSWNGGGAYRGPGFTGVQYRGPDGHEWPTGGGDPPPEIGVDDPSTGVLPGGGPGGSGGGGSTGPSGPGGGLGGGAGAVGVGTAVAGAGALAAARFGGGAVGLAGAAARPGAGGLLGAGSPGAAGAARSGAGARGGAGGARGQGLLGHGGGQKGSDKERRRGAGRGLGGPIAPHLDDEDEIVLPGDGARAGGRDDVADSSLSGD